MTKPVLKLAFCMGGGVSLGAFSGGALGEILRQILFSEAGRVLRDGKDAREFERIEIDAFMGSSAGTITLALMLRALSYSLPEEGQVNGDRIWSAIESDVDAVFGDGAYMRLREEDPDLAKAILGVARVDAIEYEAWVKRLSLGQMIAGKPKPGSAGILNPEFFGKLTAELAGFQSGPDGELAWVRGRNSTDRVLLAERVLFGGTLTALHPLDNPAAKNFKVDGLSNVECPSGFCPEYHDPALRGWLNKGVSRTARIFDIQFKGDSTPCFQNCWVKIAREGAEHWGAERDRTVLDNPKAWWEVFSTAIASGAFPGAFDPVILRRHKREFGWTDEQPGGLPAGLPQGESFYDLPYIDGGVFNNEPVAETVRLCAHLDQDQDPESYRRLVFFVDSSIPNPTPVRAFGYQQVAVSDSRLKKRGNTARGSLAKTRVPVMEAEEIGDNVLRGGLQTLSTVVSHSRTTTKTQILDSDFESCLPQVLENVCAIGPVKGNGSSGLSPRMLDGDKLSAFGGFFRETWRRNDFHAGRSSVCDTFRHGDQRGKDILAQAALLSEEEKLDPKPIQWGSVDEKEDEKRGRELADAFAEIILGRVEDVLPDALGFLDNSRLLNRIVSRKIKTLLSGEDDPREERVLQLYMPGEKSTLRCKGADVKGVLVQTVQNETLAVFDLVVTYPKQIYGLPSMSELKIRVPTFGVDQVAEYVTFEDGTENRLRGGAFLEAVRAALAHGALGVRAYQREDGVTEWTLYQPENRIDIGLHQKVSNT